ncbi:protease modulator HflC [Tardibacter chloracetimidivorans]|uniref:Protein HflC n=1 Tax=Tardibacter chloracetimidivorans TaxID=1921510 RepID=A0A1L3ZWQ7_9SPHN|nr:protease modulator HflC [Tardibacter chloracetimidivorans]API60039.1 protease modulator HflC [Tardibacter chloracetimidivorans]
MIESIMRRPFLWLGGLFALLLVLSSTLFVVPETKQAIVVRLGKPNRIVNAYDERQAFGLTGAGLVPRIPFIETVLMIDKRVLDLDMAPQTVLSTDQLRLVVDAFARFRIVDPLRMYQTVGTEERVADQLSRILSSRLRNELGKQPFAALLSPERGVLMDQIQTSVNQAARRYGAEVVDVRIKRADLPAGTPLDSAFERMRTARRLEAASIRAQGYKQAQIIRADADAKAAGIYAESFGKDAEFYSFYRAMQSYRRTFVEKNGKGEASVVLSPSNEYLQEFKGRSIR